MRRNAEHCSYPPCLSLDAEIVPQDGPKLSFIAASASVGRYLILGPIERRVLELLDGSRPPIEIGLEFSRSGMAIGSGDLTRFLAKLDEVGLLAGERAGNSQRATQPGQEYYWRWSFFNPDALFARMLSWLGWIWTPAFLVLSVALMLCASVFVVLDWPNFLHHAAMAIQGDYLAIFLAACAVTAVHESAHGLTSKAFGGRASEIGFLLIYYTLPAFYCDVSGIHLIRSRAHRLWVIAAGVYSQIVLGFAAIALWLVFSPDTWIAQTAMVFALASLLDVLMNLNPLMKLDGYYFLSQWLRIPNMMDRSRACWRDVGRSLLMALPARESLRFAVPERRILLAYGFLSLFYNFALAAAILWYSSQYLMDWLAYPGLWISAALAALLIAGPLRKTAGFWFRTVADELKEGTAMEPATNKPKWRRFVPAGLALALMAAMLMPWTASVGSYGSLVAIPNRESVIRAPESASLVVLNVQPGQMVAAGASIAQMANLDMDEQIATVRTELARVEAERDRLSGEHRVLREETMTTRWQLEQRRREFDDLDGELKRVREKFRDSRPAAATPLRLVSTQSTGAAVLPPALAALEAEANRLQSQLTEAELRRERTRALAAEGILAASERDAADVRAASLASELAGARDRLLAAVIEHQRRHANAQTGVNVAVARVSTADAQSGSLSSQIEASRKLRESLLDRLAVLERKHSQFAISSPRKGSLFGEDLPRMLGQYFEKGAEICRVADIAEVLVRVRVGEEALSDIALGQAVRVKARSFPDRIFRGVVSKLGGEGERDENGQRIYRVEFTIQNEEALLRPGMTVFARVDFGQRPVIWLLAHKLKQALRPEMWML